MVRGFEWRCFVEELQICGWQVERVSEESAVLFEPGSDISVSLVSGDVLVHASMVLMPSQEIVAEKHRSLIGLLAMKIHGRVLGCRFGYDGDSSLAVIADIDPAQQGAKGATVVLNQLLWVGTAIAALFANALRTGTVSSDAEIEAAFGRAFELDDCL